ncbi:hypothetical protein HYPSUDRAFT_86192 [Hypholoma sublateritium FD-334 SS-4]|uniref:F-box domain-containing protein n=1 Tax=Hypholoma sublateritium (strain FD-334 SS-4) TaxID=945553 RepID=A0A0D2LAJ9_HYPSF|nr:hypothetical protein HYPSUDRAFT_86192 [Hypholoma sublateritium FD-334 SS-4]
MSILELPSTTDDCILDALTPADMLKYSWTCKTAHSTVQSYMRRAFSVDKLLSRYFKPLDIDQFRQLQCQTGTLISGSTALQLFDRAVYPESDLDLYVEYRFTRTIAAWLLHIGYTYAPRPESENIQTIEVNAFRDYPPNRLNIPENPSDDIFFRTFGDAFENYEGSSAVFNFEKRSPYRKIQLITSMQPPLRTILSFHFTCVMNIITHDTAYSFFPWTTFEERCALMCKARNTKRDNAYRKYTRRGWSFVTLNDLLLQKKDDPFSSFAFAAQSASSMFHKPCITYSSMRYVGDRWCWRIPISTGIEPRKGYIESNSWTMNFGNYSYPSLHCKLLVSRKLKFCYLACGNNEDLQDFISYHMGPCAWDMPYEPM